MVIMQPQSHCHCVARAAKTIITEEEVDERLCQLSAQGWMPRFVEETSPELWVKAVQPEHLKFELNALLSTLSQTNVNLLRSGQTPPLLAKNMTLHNCQVAMGFQRYSERVVYK